MKERFVVAVLIIIVVILEIVDEVARRITSLYSRG
ncbi:MAG: hypothetical protein K0R78_417 [Pelosinus sp.]|jgi:hypothetical protein|nr:hypothetical protein [Pelosinus sp.]